MARHSSSAVLGYLGQSHHGHLANIAVDAALAKSIDDVRLELRALRSQREQLALPDQSPAYGGVLTPATLAEDARPRRSEPDFLKYVYSTRARGRTHALDPRFSDKTLCGDNCANTKHWAPRPSPFADTDSPFGFCAKCAKIRLLLLQADSDSSSSESD